MLLLWSEPKKRKIISCLVRERLWVAGVVGQEGQEAGAVGTVGLQLASHLSLFPELQVQMFVFSLPQSVHQPHYQIC